MITLSPAVTGLVKNDLLKSRPVTVCVSDVALELTNCAATVPVTSELANVYTLGVAPEGICNVTEKLHCSVAASEPPMNVSVDVPLTDEPKPQISFALADAIVKPVKAASKSIVKAISLMSAVEFSLYSSIKSTVTVSPGAAESPEIAILKRGPATTTNESLTAFPVTEIAEIVPVIALVRCKKLPAIPSVGSVITRSKVQLAPAVKLPPCS